MTSLAMLASQFVEAVKQQHTEVYNEFSLQHEFGIFLRQHISACKIQFERNVGFFFPQKESFIKKEIDITVFSPDKKDLRYAIELKYPRNGQYPVQMFHFCQDVAFAEELKKAGFSSTASMIFADDPLFYRDPLPYRGPQPEIYGLFRGQRPLHGRVKKTTGKKEPDLIIEGNYVVEWKPISGSLMYALIETDGLS